MQTRRAILPDAPRIYELISQYSDDGTLLPRTQQDIFENVRDFVVVEDKGRVVGCAALHFYGLSLAEVLLGCGRRGVSRTTCREHADQGSDG